MMLLNRQPRLLPHLAPMASTRSRTRVVVEVEEDNITAREDVVVTGAGAEVVPGATSVVAVVAVVENTVESLEAEEASVELPAVSHRHHKRLDNHVRTRYTEYMEEVGFRPCLDCFTTHTRRFASFSLSIWPKKHEANEVTKGYVQSHLIHCMALERRIFRVRALYNIMVILG